LARFKELSETDLWVLELAATVAFYHERNWKEAQRQTSLFKGITVDDNHLKEAVRLAKRFKRSA
jgi:hypothetical protein